MIKSKADRDRVRQQAAEKKINHKRGKPTAKQRGSISPSVRKALHERSGGRCERPGCMNDAHHAAHVTRRWKLSERTTLKDLLHLCLWCHQFADQTAEGRAWLKSIEEERASGE